MNSINSRIQPILAAICLIMANAASAKIIYVDDDAPAPGNGVSWSSACKYLQDALLAAGSATKPVEIQVAQGVYRPDRSSAYPDGTRDRDASFCLLDGVVVRGGFGGIGAPDPDVRDSALYESVLSGDLAGDDALIVDPCDLLTEPTRSENSRAIVKAGACSRTAVLDGFTISSGNATGGRVDSGAGLYLSGTLDAPCYPSIRNCTFRGNLGGSGGAVSVNSAYPECVACIFVQNAAVRDGGAMLISVGLPSQSPAYQFVIEKCALSNNYAGGVGGAIYGLKWPSVIEGCSFTRNHAQKGGAIYNMRSGLPVNAINCLFIHNVAEVTAGAVYFRGREGVEMTSCTLVGNTAPIGRAIACLEPVIRVNNDILAPSATITNTILWDGGDEIAVGEHVVMNVTYSDIQGGWPGEGNIDCDPLFVNAPYWDPNGTPDDLSDDFWVEGDYHLKSQAGRWDPNNQNWVIDNLTSPCIDAGDPNSPVGDEPFPNGGRINMGAYGGTGEASQSYLRPEEFGE